MTEQHFTPDFPLPWISVNYADDGDPFFLPLDQGIPPTEKEWIKMIETAISNKDPF